MTNRVVSTALRVLADRGFVVTRHPAERRQRLMAASGVDLVLDVGAAHGHYGTELRHFGYTGDIVSFEPLPSAFAELQRTRAGDAAWQLENCALGEEEGSATIHVASNSDSSSLLPPAAGHLDAAPEITFEATQQVQVRRLDDVLAPRLAAGPRTLLKIDAQGFERQVLAGAERTLEHCVALQLELSFTPLYEGGLLVDEAISLLYGRGYHLVGMTQGFADPGGAILQADGLFWRNDG